MNKEEAYLNHCGDNMSQIETDEESCFLAIISIHCSNNKLEGRMYKRYNHDRGDRRCVVHTLASSTA